MRRYILIAAVLFTSASAWADGPRGLSLASNDEAVATVQPKATEAPKAETPEVVGQPSDAVSKPSKADQPKSDQIKPASIKHEKPKFKRSPLEARVVGELHRHGIYW